MIMRWVGLFATLCLAMVGAALFMLWAVNDFNGIGVQGHVLAALLLGVVFTTLVGVGLMTLVFWSNRHRRDDLAYRFDVKRPAPDTAWVDDPD